MLFKVCVWAGDRILLKYFDPEVMAVSVVSFSFSMVAQPEHWLSLLHLVYHLNSNRLSPLARWTQLTGTQLVDLILPSNSTRWYGHTSTTTSDIWGPGCVTSFRCTSLNGIFGRVKRSKHNNPSLINVEFSSRSSPSPSHIFYRIIYKDNRWLKTQKESFEIQQIIYYLEGDLLSI